MPDAWTSNEIKLIVRAYLGMLADHAAGRPINKAAVTREISRATGRSPGSVQFKLQNASAVLSDMGEPWIPGLMPRSHYQGALSEHLRERFHAWKADQSTEGARLTPAGAPKQPGAPALDRAESLSHAELKQVVVDVLRARPNQSVAKKNLVSHVCKELDIQNLRGSRRVQFAKALNRAVGSLKQTRPPTVREYKSSLNVRIRLASPRGDKLDTSNSVQATADTSSTSLAEMGTAFSAIQPYISRLLVLCPECREGFSVPVPVEAVRCLHCSWSPRMEP
jgi:hypothetical protein